jgi:dihydrodipicolinate synthase/N-acetylneuraminate lyase
MAATDGRARASVALQAIRSGCVIPAHPLALTAQRKLDERHQRALTRYYVAAGAGGVAVGVHTTQFAIREAKHGLLKPVLELAAETARMALPRLGSLSARPAPFALVAGVCGVTAQAVSEASLAESLGYDAGLLSLAAMRESTPELLIAHCRVVADVIPLVGFYLQPAVGGIPLDYAFWRAFAEIPNVVAVKIAPFDRYRTIDVVRGIADAGRDDIALYTGNDDNIVPDLVTPFPFGPGGEPRRIVGGLLGQWAVWTRRAVELLDQARAASESDQIPADLLRYGAALTDANAAVFDVRNAFTGCIAGIHEVLRRQGLMGGTWCLDPDEGLSPGQAEEIDRVIRCYPTLTDDDFVAAHLDSWLA